MNIDKIAELIEYAASIVRLLSDDELCAEATYWRREALPSSLTTAFRVACAGERRERDRRRESP